jgi:hypothetical protein
MHYRDPPGGWMADNTGTCGRGPLGTPNNCPEMDEGTSALTLHRANVSQGKEAGQVLVAQLHFAVAASSRDASSDTDLSENSSLKIAIELFRASPESKDQVGRAVLTTLDDLAAHGKITFADLATGLEGNSYPKERRVEMNRALIPDPASSSIWLVHEAYHLSNLGTKLYIDEEIGSRELQARYASRLTQGVVYEGKTYQVKAGQGTQVLLNSYKRNQIVDWVLALPDYANDEDFLTQAWIGQHIRDWGGPGNRNRFTRKKYIDKLLEKPRLEDIGPGARALFAILESMPSDEVRFQIKSVGGGDGLKRIHDRIESAMWGTAQASFKERIIDWQKRTGFDLGFRDEITRQ